jgi:hypothetical protein
MTNRTVYGHIHIGNKFEQVIEITQDGFVYDSKHYSWTDIKKIKRYDSLFWSLLFYQGGAPVAYIFLNDGKRIRIRGRILERKGEQSDIDSSSGKSSAYEELLDLLEEKQIR